jgi:serine protease Do
VNARGEVIGVNTLIFTQSGGSEGLSFSAPSNVVRTIYEKIRAYGRVRRGIVGVNAQTLNPYMAQALGLESQWGVILGDVHPKGPAAEAGLQIGDVVLSLDGKRMENARQFNVNVYGKKVGEKTTIEVLRDGQKITKKVTVLERVDPDNRFLDRVNTEQNLVSKIGILGLDLDEEILGMMAYPPRGREGVIVAALAVDTQLLGDSFYPGDIIYAVNNRGVKGLKDLRTKLKELPYGQIVVFQVERGGQLQYLMMAME